MLPVEPARSRRPPRLRAIMTGVAPWKRRIGLLVVGTLEAVQWGLALAMFITGVVMWRDWHSLAREGVALDATVEDCTWKTMHARTGSTGGSSSGYFSCHYTYPDPGTGSTHRGYFQSAQKRARGDVLRIRYRADQPRVSASEKDLAHPSILPGALIALPVSYAVFRYYRRRRERAAGA
jgi:hypothetical protein